LEISIKDENFQEKYIKKIEIEFLEKIIDDDNWNQLKNIKKKNASMTSYFSIVNYLPEVTFLNSFISLKTTMTFNEPIEKLLCLVNEIHKIVCA
jgi:hypothetical protein